MSRTVLRMNVVYDFPEMERVAGFRFKSRLGSRLKQGRIFEASLIDFGPIALTEREQAAENVSNVEK